MSGSKKDNNVGTYNPFELRQVKSPTNDAESLIHLLKGSLGSGILTVPWAFSKAGTWFGLCCTFAVASICTYCVHILVKCAHILCHRAQIPSLSFADVAATAFLGGPPWLHKRSWFARFIVHFFLVLDLIACCCVYNVFVAATIKQVFEYYVDVDCNLRLYILMLLVPLVLINIIRTLKRLAPFSMLANVMLFLGMAITMSYLVTDLPPLSSRPAIVDPYDWPLFFGPVIFALEGIGVVMSLENNMMNPTHLIGCPSVLNIGMTVVALLFVLMGFMGFWKYGDETKGSITLNLPVEESLAQSVKIMVAFAVFFTFPLQFYVPMEIIWRGVKHRFPNREDVAEYSIRMSLVVLTVLIAIAVPQIGPFISVIGAVCLSTLGLIFPALIDLIVCWEDPGLGRYKWRLILNVFLIAFGVLAFVVGSYASILDIIENEF